MAKTPSLNASIRLVPSVNATSCVPSDHPVVSTFSLVQKPDYGR
jgi:hypothetical protein